MGLRRRRRVHDVRIFFGWADSVLWFVSGPVSYAESGLSAALVTDLQSWGDRQHQLDRPEADRIPGLRARQRVELAALAARTAAEIGREFRVAVDTGRLPGRTRRRYRSRAAATRPEAARHFRGLRYQQAAWEAEVREALGRGGRLEWRSDPPDQA